MRSPSAIAAAVAGLAGLAAAMGIGRFAFTPLLPLMQADDGLTLAQGSWLASANYLGYLVGALVGFVRTPRPVAAARGGLLVVALATAAMAMTPSYAAWWLLRFVAGIASALVLVGVSAWALAQLAARQRPALAGTVFAGVGVGIAGTGLLALAGADMGARALWLALGALAALIALGTWPLFGRGAAAAGATARVAGPPLGAAGWRLVAVHGLFGFGYIVPATFLPAAARSLVGDPAVFGWAWPVFGAAAALSTVAASRFAHALPPVALAVGCLVLSAVGLVLPAVHPGLPSILGCALAVGGTFMVMTMAVLQEARRIAGAAPARLMSALTAAFAFGQLLGPLVVAGDRPAAEAIVAPGLAAAALLLAGAAWLGRDLFPASAAKEAK